jgi:RNA polymerase sigma-70 factor (ECF subfamily)
MHTDTPEAEFHSWYQRTSPRIFAYVRRQCDPADCEDVIAEVYLAAWRHFTDLPSDPMPWLFGTARKVLANHWRSKSRRERLTTTIAGLNHVASPDCATTAVERSDLLHALSRLTTDDREVLLLVGWDGLDASGVAEVLGCTTTAARARLSRARRRLATHLDPHLSQAPALSLVTEGN